MLDNKWIFFILGIGFAVFLLPILQAWFHNRGGSPTGES